MLMLLHFLSQKP